MSTRPWSHVDGHTCTDLSLPLVDRGITVQFSSIPLIPAYVDMPTFQVIALAAAGALLFDPVSSSLLIRDPKNPCVRQRVTVLATAALYADPMPRLLPCGILDTFTVTAH